MKQPQKRNRFFIPLVFLSLFMMTIGYLSLKLMNEHLETEKIEKEKTLNALLDDNKEFLNVKIPLLEKEKRIDSIARANLGLMKNESSAGHITVLKSAMLTVPVSGAKH